MAEIAGLVLGIIASIDAMLKLTASVTTWSIGKRDPLDDISSFQEVLKACWETREISEKAGLERCHLRLAIICLEIIEKVEVMGPCSDSKGNSQPHLVRFLQRYAFSCWAYHVRNAGQNQRALQQKVHRCLSQRYKLHLKTLGCSKEPSWEEKFSHYLMISAQYGLVGLAKTYLEMGVSTESTSGIHQHTPLHLAARTGSAPVIEILLRHGASLNRVDRHGNSALHFAAYRGNGEIATLLLKAGADPNGGDISGCSRNGAALPEETKFQRCNNCTGFCHNCQLTSLGARCPECKLSREDQSYSTQTDFNRLGTCSLRTCILRQKNEAYFTPLILASHEGHLRICEMLLEKGTAIDNSEEINTTTPLHAAVCSGQREIIRLLLEHGANPQSKTRFGEKPATIAARIGLQDVIGMLQANESREEMERYDRGSILPQTQSGLSMPPPRPSAQCSESSMDSKPAESTLWRNRGSIDRTLEHTKDSPRQTNHRPNSHRYLEEASSSTILSPRIAGSSVHPEDTKPTLRRKRPNAMEERVQPTRCLRKRRMI